MAKTKIATDKLKATNMWVRGLRVNKEVKNLWKNWKEGTFLIF